MYKILGAGAHFYYNISLYGINLSLTGLQVQIWQGLGSNGLCECNPKYISPLQYMAGCLRTQCCGVVGNRAIDQGQKSVKAPYYSVQRLTQPDQQGDWQGQPWTNTQTATRTSSPLIN